MTTSCSLIKEDKRSSKRKIKTSMTASSNSSIRSDIENNLNLSSLSVSSMVLTSSSSSSSLFSLSTKENMITTEKNIKQRTSINSEKLTTTATTSITDDDYDDTENHHKTNVTMLPFIRSKRRASDTLIATATALLKVLGFNNNGKKSSKNKNGQNQRKGSLFSKLNGQQQVLSTMPAMPKEKTSPIPLNECKFAEMKMKEQLVGSSKTTVTVPASMQRNKIPDNILTDCNNTTTLTQRALQHHHHHHHQQQQQQQQQTKSDMTKLYSSSSCNSICLVNGSNSIRSTSTSSSSSSPSAAVVSTVSPTNETMATTTATTTTGQITNNTLLMNGSAKNLYNNSRNDLNSKNLNNGIISSNVSGYYCNNGRTTISSLTDTTPQRIINNLSSSSTTMTTSTGTTTAAASSSSSSNVRSSSVSSPSTTNITVSMKPNSSTTPRGTTAAGTGGMPAKKSAKDYVFGKIIGEGSFSTVCLARDIHTNREYAIKICYKPHILREKKQEYVRREREIMHIMNNVPGFVNLSCTFQDYRNLYFVMTLAKNGDLLPYINKVGSFDLDCTRHYAAELVLAIENMHKRGVIHRDLKPENILLDENMHTLIADFGSAKTFDVNREKEMMLSSPSPSTMTTATTATTATTPTTPNDRNGSGDHVDSNRKQDNNKIANDDNDNDNDDDYDNDSPRPIRKRRGSFVGTAQYVSPEVLQGEIVTRSADLWALGCIIYQMISGLPPFRGGSDYLIFREIMNLNLIFPEGFDKNAEDLVRNLLKLNPNERLGANDPPIGKYDSIRSHSFFNCIEWDKIRTKSPPQIYPYLPGVSKDEELRSHYRVPDNLEPGLDDKQLTRLLGLELGTITITTTTPTATTTTTPTTINRKESLSSVSSLEKKAEPKTFKDNLNLSENEKHKRLEAQKLDKWHQFADNEIILKKGFVNKRKGLFARKRMLLLTTGPRLIYIDPVQMIKKGEIPWSPALRVEPKNFKIFFVHTPNRTYYLEDPEGYALEWVNAIEDVRQKTYGDKS